MGMRGGEGKMAKNAAGVDVRKKERRFRGRTTVGQNRTGFGRQYVVRWKGRKRPSARTYMSGGSKHRQWLERGMGIEE